MAMSREERLRRRRERYYANRDELLSKQKAYAEKNKDKIKERYKQYYQENKEAFKERASRWAKDNPERRKEIRSKHQTKIRAQRAARQKLRECRKRQCLDWLTETQILEMQLFYEIAAWYDEPMHVDHIVPLFGKNVCGLHVPWNLQLLPARENCSKSNKLLEEVGG